VIAKRSAAAAGAEPTARKNDYGGARGAKRACARRPSENKSALPFLWGSASRRRQRGDSRLVSPRPQKIQNGETLWMLAADPGIMWFQPGQAAALGARPRFLAASRQAAFARAPPRPILSSASSRSCSGLVHHDRISPSLRTRGSQQFARQRLQPGRPDQAAPRRRIACPAEYAPRCVLTPRRASHALSASGPISRTCPLRIRGTATAM